MSKLISTANAIVDITTAQTVVSAEWSHADRITEGKQPDVVVVKTIAEAITADTRFAVTLIETREAAANPTRRARIISEATAAHATRIAEYAAQPEVEAPKVKTASTPKSTCQASHYSARAKQQQRRNREGIGSRRRCNCTRSPKVGARPPPRVARRLRHPIQPHRPPW